MGIVEIGKSSSVKRFFTLTAATMDDLVAEMNEQQEALARVIFIGQDENNLFVAVFDRALPVTLTYEDMVEFNASESEESENKESLEEVQLIKKLNLAA